MPSSKPVTTSHNPAEAAQKVQKGIVDFAAMLSTALQATQGKLHIVEPKKSDVPESDAAPKTKTP